MSETTRESVSTFPEGFTKQMSSDEVAEVSNWINSGGPLATLGLLLRIDERHAESLERLGGGGFSFHQEIYESSRWPLQVVRDAWLGIVGSDSPWRNVLPLRGIHCCALRGPKADLQRFLSWASLSNDAPLAGILVSEMTQAPEALCGPDTELLRAEMEADQLLELVLPQAISHAQEFPGENHNAQFLASEELAAAVQAAISGEQLTHHLKRHLKAPLTEAFLRMVGFADRGGEAEREATQVAKLLSAGGSYLNNLGIGDFEHWGDNVGDGHCLCVLDSGADESHLMLQRQVKDYVRFDFAGQQKEAYACMDHACHGTKIASLICGKRVARKHLGLGDVGDLRLGIAPGAKVSMVSTLGGAFKRESGTIIQMLAGLDWVAEQCDGLGYEVVNISIEPSYVLSPVLTKRLDLVLDLLKHKKMTLIFAAGNRGASSQTFGTVGTYVGAADRSGTPSPANGSRVDLLAPGANLLCAQPNTPQLYSLSVGCYGGSSLAAAIVSASVVGLASRHKCPAGDALHALKRTTDASGFINIVKADNLLGRLPRS